MTPFREKVLSTVKQIPFGKVCSYGQVALMCDYPRGARAVGWVLNRHGGEDGIPWWRVINNQGRISIKGFEFTALDQKKLLEEEGVFVTDDLKIDINAYRYIPENS